MDFAFAFGFAIGAAIGAMGAWFDWWRGTSWPLTPTIAGIMTVGFAIWHYRANRPKWSHVAHGMRAERVVADMLADLSQAGYHSVHDLADATSDGRPCNIDHVLAGPEGVFVLETKRRARGESGGHRARVGEDGIRLDGRLMHPDPRGQAAAAAASVRDRLKERCGYEASVRAVLLLPDWFVEDPDLEARVWVLNPKYLVKRLASPHSASQRSLGPEELRRVRAELTAWSREPHPD